MLSDNDENVEIVQQDSQDYDSQDTREEQVFNESGNAIDSDHSDESGQELSDDASSLASSSPEISDPEADKVKQVERKTHLIKRGSRTRILNPIWDQFKTVRGVDGKIESNICKGCKQAVSPQVKRMKVHVGKCKVHLQNAAPESLSQGVPLPAVSPASLSSSRKLPEDARNFLYSRSSTPSPVSMKQSSMHGNVSRITSTSKSELDL